MRAASWKLEDGRWRMRDADADADACADARGTMEVHLHASMLPCRHPCARPCTFLRGRLRPWGAAMLCAGSHAHGGQGGISAAD